jgi:hypothetical protein
MKKIPYDLIAIEADKLISRMVLSSEIKNYYVMYLLYINACGWSERDFDKETLSRIDSSWEENRFLN